MGGKADRDPSRQDTEAREIVDKSPFFITHPLPLFLEGSLDIFTLEKGGIYVPSSKRGLKGCVAIKFSMINH